MTSAEFMRKRWANDKDYRDRMMKVVNGSSDKNGHWKGGEAKYASKHMWLFNHYGPANMCENCNIKNAEIYEWANLSGKHLRSRDDYMMLCKRCHMALDRSRHIWQSLLERRELEVWQYIAMTPVEQDEIVHLDADPSGHVYSIEYHYSPPKKYVDEQIAELSQRGKLAEHEQ